MMPGLGLENIRGEESKNNLSKKTRIIAKQLRTNVEKIIPGLPSNFIQGDKEHDDRRYNVINGVLRVFSENEYSVSTCMLYGKSGVGKTCLATVLANKLYNDCNVMCWFQAGQPLLEQFRYFLWQYFSILPSNDLDIIGSFYGSLAEQENWLIIFDNVEQFKEIKDFLPSNHIKNRIHRGYCIITSQDEKNIDCENFPKFQVLEFSQNENNLFYDGIKKNIKIEKNEYDFLSEHLDFHPKAIKQALNDIFIKRKFLSVYDYCQKLEAVNFILLDFFENDLQIIKSLLDSGNTEENNLEDGLIAKIYLVVNNDTLLKRTFFSFNEIKKIKYFLDKNNHHELSRKILDNIHIYFSFTLDAFFSSMPTNDKVEVAEFLIRALSILGFKEYPSDFIQILIKTYVNDSRFFYSEEVIGSILNEFIQAYIAENDSLNHGKIIIHESMLTAFKRRNLPTCVNDIVSIAKAYDNYFIYDYFEPLNNPLFNVENISVFLNSLDNKNIVPKIILFNLYMKLANYFDYELRRHNDQAKEFYHLAETLITQDDGEIQQHDKCNIFYHLGIVYLRHTENYKKSLDYSDKVIALSKSLPGNLGKIYFCLGLEINAAYQIKNAKPNKKLIRYFEGREFKYEVQFRFYHMTC